MGKRKPHIKEPLTESPATSPLSEKLVHGLFEYAPDAIVVIDAEGKMAHLNIQVETMFGYRRNELLGKSVEVLIPERFRQRHLRHRSDYIAQPRRRSMGVGLDLWGRRKDGSEFPVDIMLSPMGSGGEGMVIATVRDITEWKRTEDLERKLITSERQVILLGELAASLAHDLNNPLGIIMGFAEDALTELKPEDPHYEALKIIEQETQRCKKIMDHLRGFVRPSTENFFQSVDLNGIVRSSVRLVGFHLQKAGVAVNIESDQELPLVRADARQLEQVLINLFFNAAEAMPLGGTLTVRAMTSKSPMESDAYPKEVIIAVSDTGAGIEAADLPKIFQPFFSTKENRCLGLGLSISERIIQDHGGKIRAESSLGKGSTFYLHLPVG